MAVKTLGSVVEALEREETVQVLGLVGPDGSPCPKDAVAGLALTDVTFDSRAVEPGALFVCKGAAFKLAYLDMAAQRGACAYLAQQAFPAAGIPGIVVSDVRKAMALAACFFFDNPSRALSLVALTGTKGKTTTAFYIDAMLRARPAGPDARMPRSALLTGVVVDDGLSRGPSHNTTPESVELQRYLARAVAAGCDVAVMEASSQGLKYDRTLGTHFAVGVFTNIGEDHISPDEHPTFEDYFSSKLRIFDQSDCGVVNLSCDHLDRVLAAARANCGRVLTYQAFLARQEPRKGRASDGVAQPPDGSRPADVRLVALDHAGLGEWRLTVETPRGVLSPTLPALGSFNVDNAVAAIAALEALGVDHAAMEAGLARARVPGRMEMYANRDKSLVGIVDYAHNEMSMQALLSCVREEFPGRQLTVVFGSCGKRGLDRREGLGRVAGRLADRVILTEDEPAGVDVGLICAEIGEAVRAAGGTYDVVADREQAIGLAVGQARAPAVVVLAGKGAEQSMERGHGAEPYGPDARILCGLLGCPFEGYGPA